MNFAVIELGSNVEPDKNIPKAIQAIGQKFHIQAQSEFILTNPVSGTPGQAMFLNGAVLLETDMDLANLVATLHTIEQALGRTRQTDKYAPRIIDLDVIIWNGGIVHPDFFSRDFVKITVLEAIKRGNRTLALQTFSPQNT